MMMTCQNKKKVKATTTSCVSFHLKQRIFIEVLTNAQVLKWEMEATRSGGVYVHGARSGHGDFHK